MTLKQRAVAVLREPLAHFLLAGVAVFTLLSGRPPDTGERRIVVSENIVNSLVARWSQNFRRAPSQAEIDGLIGEYVKDQVYYHEALRLGLDQDDEVVMRRMRNKLVGFAASDAEAATPSDAQLRKLLGTNPARYSAEARYSFTQVYLGADTPDNNVKARAALAAIRQGAPARDFPVAAPIQGSYQDAPASDLAGIFGDGFPPALGKLPVGEWAGPVESGLGLHLVRIDRREVPHIPQLADVRQRLENDWRADKKRKAEDEAFKTMLAGYDVRIEKPR